MSYREEPLDKQVKDLRKEVEGLRGSSPAQYYLLYDLNEWRWPLTVMGLAFLAFLALPERMNSPRASFVHVDPGELYLFEVPVRYPSMVRSNFDGYPLHIPHPGMDGGLALTSGGVNEAGGCTWDDLDSDDCGYASGFGCEFDTDCDRGHACSVDNVCEPVKEEEDTTSDFSSDFAVVCDSAAPSWQWECHIEMQPGEPARFERWVDDPWGDEPAFWTQDNW